MTNQPTTTPPSMEEKQPSIKHEEIIEAILFAAGHPVSYDRISQTLEISPSHAKDLVKSYATRYNSTRLPRGVILITFDNSCQLCTKEEYISYIRSALGIRKSGSLSASSIETLAIVAYHQPVTRAYIDAVRGVDSSYAVTNLLERELIDVRGRMDAPGRPMLYGTTENFLRCFGLSSLSQLPGIESEEISRVFSTIETKMSQEENLNQISIDEMTGVQSPVIIPESDMRTTNGTPKD